jgi:hypothetical protein
MKGSEIINNLIKEGYKDFLILAPRTEYDPGCVGYEKEEKRLVYDYNLLFNSLCNSWRSTFKTEDELWDAVDDHLAYNTLRSLAYHKNSPIVLIENKKGNKVRWGEK